MSASHRLRFTILEHDHPFLHWDLLIQQGDVLATWRLLRCPEANVWLPAEVLPYHRLMYLDYEGPVSGDRGFVSRFTSGLLVELPNLDNTAIKKFQLFDTTMANTATCRGFDTKQPEWRFE